MCDCNIVDYNGTYIRKTTALYLLQENFKVSSDRLLRVRADQPTHIFSGLDLDKCGRVNCVQAGDLCVFNRVDCQGKCLVGRIIQFSYMEGNKKERQYSSNYVDLSKKSYKNVGVLANWYQGTRISEERSKSIVDFKPLGQLFTPGYLSLAYYCATIDDSALTESHNHSFGLSVSVIEKVLPQWRRKLTFDIS